MAEENIREQTEQQSPEPEPEPEPNTGWLRSIGTFVNTYINTVSCILTLFAIIIAGFGIYYTKKSFETATRSMKITEDTLEITRQAFHFEIFKSKPQFDYKLVAKIYPHNPIKNDFQATVELVRGVPVRDVNIVIKAGLIDSKQPRVVFNYPKELVQPGDKFNFDKKNSDFMERMDKNLKGLDPNVFSGKKLNLLRLYAQYCVRVGNKNILYDDEEIGICKQIVPEYR